MEQEKRRIWFPYLSVDYKAAEARLNELGAQGWRLTDMANNFFTCSLPVFQRESRPVRYCVVLSKSYPGREPYLDLCAEAGWQFICCTDGLDYFVSAPGERPVPVETDSVLERRKALRRFLRNSALYLLLALGLLALMLSAFFKEGHYNLPISQLTDGSFINVCLRSLVTVCFVGWLGGVTLFYWHRCRQTEEPPVPGQRWARIRGAVNQSLWGLILLLYVADTVALGIGLVNYYRTDWSEEEDPRSAPVVMGVDLGLEPVWMEDGYVSRESSALLSGVTYSAWRMEAEDVYLDNRIYSERYEARWSWMARLAERILLWQEGTGRTGHQQALEYHGPLDFAPAELGFDAAWIAHGEGYDTLILRQGDITACIEAPADLTDPALLARVAGRLELEGSAYG